MTVLTQFLPTAKNEHWKYADFSQWANKKFVKACQVDVAELEDAINQQRLQRGESILVVTINGHFMPSLSDLAKLPPEVIVCTRTEAQSKYPTLVAQLTIQDAKKYPFAHLNTQEASDGLFLYVAANYQLKTPIHLLTLTVGNEEFIAHPQQQICLGQQAELTLIEEYFSLVPQAYVMNVVTTITASKEAKLEHYKIQKEGLASAHLATCFVYQQQDSQVNFTQLSLGSIFARDDLVVKLQDKGAHCSAYGFYNLQTPNQYIDHHLEIEHAAAYSQSEMLYKGVINNKARAVFNGKVHVLPHAQKITAYQRNNNLLLDKQAEAYSKPELEIYADDVKCKHGSTIGQMDQDAIFYLRSRGIAEEEAVAILLNGFSAEIIQRISHPGIRLRAEEAML